MSDKCCADCFWFGEKIGGYRSGDYNHRCNKTRKIISIDDCCSNFLDQNNAKACWECDYFGTHNCGSVFEKSNYCERKSKVVDPKGLACSSFIES